MVLAATRPPNREAELRVTAAVKGDRRALEALTMELLPRVRNLVRYLARGDRDVDDLAQEALIVVLRGLRTFRGEGSLESWVDRVVAREVFRRLKRRHEEEPPGGTAEPAEIDLGDEYAARRRLALLLDRLSLEQRHAVVARFVLEMSVAEIAEETSAPVETVRSRLRLAKQKLREWGMALEAEEAE